MRREISKPEPADEYDAQWVEGLLLAPDRVRRFSRASQYDPRWVWENAAGSHSLWLAKALCETIDLQPGMRVLNLVVERADNFADGEGFDLFYTWTRVMKREQGLLTADGGRNISLVRLVARKQG